MGSGMKELTVTSDQLECKEEGGESVFYHGSKPFTGRVRDFDKNRQKFHACNLNEGLLDGLWVTWHNNGNKKNALFWSKGSMHGRSTHWYKKGTKEREEHWENGKLMSAEVWKPNGEKCPDTNVKNGNGVMVAYDVHSWPVLYRLAYKDGEPVVD